MGQCAYCGSNVGNQPVCPKCGVGTDWSPLSEDRPMNQSMDSDVARVIRGVMTLVSFAAFIAVIGFFIYAIQIMSALGGG
jgi:hypothetical protein